LISSFINQLINQSRADSKSPPTFPTYYTLVRATVVNRTPIMQAFRSPLLFMAAPRYVHVYPETNFRGCFNIYGACIGLGCIFRES